MNSYTSCLPFALLAIAAPSFAGESFVITYQDGQYLVVPKPEPVRLESLVNGVWIDPTLVRKFYPVPTSSGDAQ